MKSFLLSAPRPQGSRQSLYNSQLVGVIAVHESLRILRVRPDSGRLQYKPGQYTVLGLGDWEPSVGESAPASDGAGRLIQRAYSCSASLLDSQLRLVRGGRSIDKPGPRIRQKRSSALISPPALVSRKPSLVKIRCMAVFWDNIWAVTRSSLSSRPMSTRRRTSSVPRPAP